MFEYFLINKNPDAVAEYENLHSKIKGSKEDLMKNGYEEIVLDDFYDNFLECFESLKEPKFEVTDESAVEKYLESLF